jgi:2-dehydropantoate 2-reductase
MKIAIIGPGAVGGYFGAKLVQAGFDVTFLARGAHLQAILNKGLTVKSILGDFHVENLTATDKICVSGLLAVTKTTYGHLREYKETRFLMIDLLREIFLLSQKAGINIEPGFVEKTVSFIDTFPYDSTSSLTRDVWENKPSEIEYQNGTVVRLREKYGVDTAINKFAYHCILPNELKVRGLKTKTHSAQ